MLLVVMSYYKHYHITQLAIKKAIAHIPDINKVMVIWDDTHEPVPEIPIYSTIQNCDIGAYTWSGLQHIIVKNESGWFNQQLIKLHMDLIVNDKEFIIMDGDLILNQFLNPRDIMYATQVPSHHLKYNHLDQMLGLYYGDFSSCPIMYVNSVWLKNIRNICTINTDIPLIDMLIKHSPAVNEWDLISKYVLNVLRLPKRIEPFYYARVTPNNLVESFNDIDNFVLFGDDLVDKEFWIKNNVVVDNNLYAAKL